MLHSVYWMLGAETLGIVYSDGRMLLQSLCNQYQGSEQLNDIVVE